MGVGVYMLFLFNIPPERQPFFAALILAKQTQRRKKAINQRACGLRAASALMTAFLPAAKRVAASF
jgi:hypothetical protein